MHPFARISACTPGCVVAHQASSFEQSQEYDSKLDMASSGYLIIEGTMTSIDPNWQTTTDPVALQRQR